MTNVIVTENLNTGSSGWQFSKRSNTAIQAYMDATSYDPNTTITFFVSTQSAGTSYSISLYRLGWYGGLGGCLKATINNASGLSQGTWNLNTNVQTVACPTAIVDSTTHSYDCNWASTDTWAIPSNACPGVYLAVFADASNNQYITPFVVRGNSGADYLYMRPSMTDHAYNQWGGYSLYTDPTVGVIVNLNRPLCQYGGVSQMLAYELNFIRWIEMQGYNIAYYTDIDVHGNASLLTSSKVVLVAGHSEYWTLELRNAVVAAIAAGVSTAFMGANASYWQVRLGSDPAGHSNRTITCYKVLTGSGNLALDPFYGVDNARLTTQWRDPALNRPENAMIGISYYDNTQGSNFAWVTDASMDTTYTAGTGLVANTSYGSDIVGNEWDNTTSNPGTVPSNLKIIGTSPATGVNHGSSNAKTTFYRASSGALVFAAGSLSLTNALDTYRYTGAAAGNVAVVPGIQVLMANIMGALKGPVFSMVSM